MLQPLSLGTELEVIFAYVPDFEEDGEKDGKTREFPAVPDEDEYGDEVINIQKWVFRHIAEQLHRLGLPVDMDNLSEISSDKWRTVNDASIPINHPSQAGYQESEYRTTGVEIVSPILIFSQKALEDVKNVCLLLENAYDCRNDPGTGLHVHVGHYPSTFTFISLKNIMAFLWTFENQLSSLHPTNRQRNFYCSSMRQLSNLNCDFQDRFSSPPTPHQAVTTILGGTDRTELVRLLEHGTDLKRGHYNFLGQISWEEVGEEWGEKISDKQTIELRQHAGTFDVEAVINRIKVIAGIIDFCENEHLKSFHSLLMEINREENWEFKDDRKDDSREAGCGPVLSHRGFTIIDLLQYMVEKSGASLDTAFDPDSSRWPRHRLATLLEM